MGRVRESRICLLLETGVLPDVFLLLEYHQHNLRGIFDGAFTLGSRSISSNATHAIYVVCQKRYSNGPRNRGSLPG